MSTDLVQSTAPRRVKVYTLEGEKWIDRGTGYCSGEVEGGPHFIVRNENDTSDTLLTATIEGSTQYQRQQDTLIVWTDSEGNDYALSFQEPEGCLSLCEFLINIQHNIEPNISLVAVISNGQDGEITEVIAGPVPEPCFPTDENLSEVLDLLNQGSKSNKFRETLLEFIENRDYLNKLIETFERNERNKNLGNLYFLCDIIKTLVFYNDQSIFETFLGDEVIIGIIGMLEYDPEFPNLKSNNREYLVERTNFKEVIPITDDEIKELIKKTFRLQFLKDVVLARFLDDITFNCISTMIHLNEDVILKFIKEDKDFLNDLFALYHSETSNDLLEKQRQGIQLIHQFVLIAKKFTQLPRTGFYKALIDKGLFKMIQFAFKDSLTESRILATEIIVSIIEHDVLLLNNKEIDDGNTEMDMALMIILIDVLINEFNVGLKTQSFEALKVLLDPVNIAQPSSPIGSSPSTNSSIDENTGNNNGNEYLQSFYKNVAAKMFDPILKIDKLTQRSDSKINKNLTITYSNLCELLNFASKEHEKPLSRSFILENHLLVGISKLMHKRFSCQLRLSALRCLKSIIMLDDEFYTRYIIQNDLLKEFMFMLEETSSSNNLVNSTCLNLLNLILKNENFINFKLLKNYLVTNYRFILKTNYLGKELVFSEIKSDDGYDSELIDKDDSMANNEQQTNNRDDNVDDDDDTQQNRDVSLTSPDPPTDEYEINTNNIALDTEDAATASSSSNDDDYETHKLIDNSPNTTAATTNYSEKRSRADDLVNEADDGPNGDSNISSPEKRKKLGNILLKAGKYIGLNNGNNRATTATIIGGIDSHISNGNSNSSDKLED